MTRPSKKELRHEIARILQGANLATLSSKKVRMKLQDTFQLELTDRKKEIDQILMALIAKSHTAHAKEEEKETTREVQSHPSPVIHEEEEAAKMLSSSDEVEDLGPPVKRKKKKKKQTLDPVTKTTKAKKEKSPKKKEPKLAKKKEAPKSQASVEDSEEEQTLNDEMLAWKLHQEESRRTRKTSARKGAPVKTKTTSKAASKRENGANKDKAKTGYIADMILSPELASILGTDRMSRHEVVKRMWGIIKERNLMDPRNKQFHICDDELFRVFGRRRIRTFSMMKYLKGHIKDPRNLTTAV
ncbi:uncharacterized protein [Diadema antillarum]